MKNIHEDRIHHVKKADKCEGKYILYIVTKSFREHWNHSLEFAVGQAEQESCGVVVATFMRSNQKHLTERHIKFHLEGLQEFSKALSDRNIKFIFRIGNFDSETRDLSQNAKAIVTDFPYLREDKETLKVIRENYMGNIYAVESNVVIPIESVSKKKEYAARTIRSKIMDTYTKYIEKPTSSTPPVSTLNYSIQYDSVQSIDKVIDQLTFSNHTSKVSKYQGGQFSAKDRFNKFMSNEIKEYDDSRQKPTEPAVSEMSMYLRFGHIAPSYLLSRLERKRKTDNIESYIEELLVRRELTHNFLHFSNDDYDSLSSLPEWARETLEAHKDDEREYSYTRSEFENSETHDEAWNECMLRMKENGYLHNHMRMFWGKQILAWSNTPSYAHKTILYLNNKYFLDGNDPNSYANALWIFGLHDRAWGENQAFGKVRKMNKSGLERKIDVEQFVSEDD